MKISFDLKIEDWVAFQEYYKEKKAPLYKYLTPLLVFSAVLITTINVMYLFYQKASLVTLFSFFLVIIILYILFLKKRMKKQLKKTALDIKSKNPEAFGTREMNFDNECIEITAGNSHKKLTWSELSKFDQNTDYFFLYSQKGMVYIIPKRDLKENSELEKILEENLKEI